MFEDKRVFVAVIALVAILGFLILAQIVLAGDVNVEYLRTYNEDDDWWIVYWSTSYPPKADIHYQLRNLGDWVICDNIGNGTECICWHNDEDTMHMCQFRRPSPFMEPDDFCTVKLYQVGGHGLEELASVHEWCGITMERRLLPWRRMEPVCR